MVLKYFLVLFLISMLLVGRLFWPFVSILILSFLLAGIFQPLYAIINRKFSPSFSSLATCFIIILIVFIPLIFFVSALSQEALGLYHLSKGTNLALAVKQIITESALMLRLQEVLAGYGMPLEPDKVGKTIADLSSKGGLFLFNQVSAWATNIMLFVFDFFIMILTIYFLLADHERLINFILRISPLPDDQERQLIQKFKQIAGAVLIGNGICGIIQGVLGGLAFWFFDLNAPILWGGIMLILAFLPIFGIGLVLVPAAGVLFLQGNPGQGIIMLIFYATISFSVEYLLKPQMVGKQVKMHTLLVFLSILGGLKLFGFLGIIYGPLIITMFMTMAEIYITNYDWYVTHD
ncbi:MAG: AI-2E family transporter [Proteobacteria bacterium]|nr:AI-2E family transporter [Pseudomonadota bacterium]MBU1688455.1 AI-2E family transporter [Pseudomonadota bacterium]